MEDEDDRLSLATRPESLTQIVYEAIRDAIVNKTLAPGSRVTEASLAERLRVSKTPVREALLKLRAMGLIEPDGRRGGRIVQPSRTGIQHAYEVREALEVYACRAAAERASDPDIGRIADAASRCLAAATEGDIEGFRTWDSVFHETIAESAGNPRLTELIEETFAVIMTLRRRDAPHSDYSIKCARAHVRIADAIQSRKPDEAEHAMRAHVHQVEGYVLASLAENPKVEEPVKALR